MDDKLSAADAEGLPDDALFFLADQPGTVNELVMKLYEQPNKATIDWRRHGGGAAGYGGSQGLGILAKPSSAVIYDTLAP